MSSHVAIFKLLSDETRLRLIMLLFKEDLCVCQLVEILGVSQPTVSKILSRLKDMGLVTDRRKDKYVYYSLLKENDFLIEALLLVQGHADASPQLVEDLEKLKDKEQYLLKCKDCL